MATLVSPGVSITVTDESMYVPAGAGTVPLIVIATAQNKASPDGSGIAPYTTPATAGKLQLVTSQRELITGYGNPKFKSVGGTPQHGHELNEYGLLAAYSFLGISNRAYVLRADMDLAELEASATPPSGEPEDGSYWLDTASTAWGLKKWSGTAWVKQIVRIPNASQLELIGTGTWANYYCPKGSYGVDREYAVVYTDDQNVTSPAILLFQKLSSSWHLIGSQTWRDALTDPTPGSPATTYQPNSYLTLPATANTTDSVILQMDAPNNGSEISMKLYSTSLGQYVTVPVVGKKSEADIFTYNPDPAEGDLWADYDNVAPLEAVIFIKRHNGDSQVVITSTLPSINLDLTDFRAAASNSAMTISLIEGSFPVPLTSDADSDGFADEYDIAEDINAAISNAVAASTIPANLLEASVVDGRLTITHLTGRPITIVAGNISGYSVATDLGIATGLRSNWELLSYEANATGATSSPAEGTLWYDNVTNSSRVDLLVNNFGNWITYTGAVTVSATQPLTAANNSIWVDSSDLENFPQMYKRVAGVWTKIDTTDQVSGDGILFADFRAAKSASLDDDAPDGDLYPWGMLAWNKRASGGNVKQYLGGKWVDYSGNKADGSPYMMRKAQRQSVVRAMQAAITSNEDLRNETTRFNLMACPGYMECLDELITLNIDRKETAFILCDTPFRLAPTGTAIVDWVNNTMNASTNGEDGLVTFSPYVGVYYPHGLTSTTIDGVDAMVPATHMALRTIAFNDQVAYPWFAPAGYQRGIVTNATSTGYLNATTGEYTVIALGEGQRDVLYLNKINPIATFPNRGIVVFGQKTLNPIASALDRINVARLVVYLREVLNDAVKPLLFEPNDEPTRVTAKAVVDRVLANLVSSRGLYDYLTVCDTSNNTPARIDRNELHIDIAIQPTKTVEFIYIPIRIQSTQS